MSSLAIAPTRDPVYAEAFVNTLLGGTTGALEALNTCLVGGHPVATGFILSD